MAYCRLCKDLCSWACFGCKHPQERRVWTSNWRWECQCGAEGDGVAVGLAEERRAARWIEYKPKPSWGPKRMRKKVVNLSG